MDLREAQQLVREAQHRVREREREVREAERRVREAEHEVRAAERLVREIELAGATSAAAVISLTTVAAGETVVGYFAGSLTAGDNELTTRRGRIYLNGRDVGPAGSSVRTSGNKVWINDQLVN